MRGSYLFHLMLLSLSWPCMALEGEARRFGDADVDLGGGTLASNEARARLNDDITLRKFIIIPEIKLLFCSIPKVAHSQFHQILQAVREVARREQGLKEPLPKTKIMLEMNGPEYHGLDVAELEEMLIDPAWKKVVFYRDPVTRFLSGYRSKCEKGHDEGGHGSRHCEIQFGSRLTTFDKAIATMQAGEVSDDHWAHQMKFCGGLGHTLEHYDMVAELRPHDEEGSMMELLQLIGLDTDSLDRAISKEIVRPKNYHTTKAEEQLCEYYNTREKWETIVKHYKEDYELFHMEPIPPPCSWD
ncbi:unnamed protein product [Chrysoparadoxa australica]